VATGGDRGGSGDNLYRASFLRSAMLATLLWAWRRRKRMSVLGENGKSNIIIASVIKLCGER